MNQVYAGLKAGPIAEMASAAAGGPGLAGVTDIANSAIKALS